MYILAPFWDAQTIQNRQKNVFETDAFFNTIFVAFFFDFLAILDRFWEAQGGQKLQKITTKRRRGAFGARLKCIWTFGAISETILKRFN